jgi:hypothetical protein
MFSKARIRHFSNHQGGDPQIIVKPGERLIRDALRNKLTTMFKIICIFLFLTGFLINSTAQQVYFSKHFTLYPNVGMAALNISPIGSEYHIVGTGGDSIFTSQNVLLMAKIDSLGEVIHYKTIYRPDTFLFCGAEGGALFQGANILIAGSQNTNGNSNPILYKMDTSYQVIWNKMYLDTDTYPYSIGTTVRETINKTGYVMAGEHGISIQTSFFQLIRTDTLGNLLWRKYYGGAYNKSRCENLVVLPDGGYLLGGYTFSSVVNSLNGMLVKTDSMGNQIWRKQYGGFYKDGFARIALALDGNYIIGNVFEINPNTPLVNQINIIKTDTAGNILWNKTYCKPRMLTLLHSIKALDDSLGLTSDTEARPCHLIGIEERVLSIQELEVFPNPFSEIMHVVLPEGYSGGKLLMYDVQGKKAMETEVPAHWGQQNFALETNLMNPGIYLLELTDRDGRVWRRKAVRR